MNNSHKRFADIFDEWDDPASVTHVTHLETIYTNTPAPEMLPWAQLKVQLLKKKQEHAWWKRLFIKQQATWPVSGQARRLRPSRLSLATTLVIGLLLCTTVVYAYGGSALDALLQQLQSVHQSPQAHLYTDLDQSQTFHGFTLTLSKAYADANRVILGYTVTPSHGSNATMNPFVPGLAQLKTQQGTPLPGMIGNESTSTGILGLVLNFDALPIQGTPPRLQLQLKIPYSDQPQNQPYRIQGWLTYDFAVPFHPARRVAVVHQSQTSNGHAIVLDHLIVSQSETRLCMRGGFTGEAIVTSPPTLSVGTLKNDRSVDFSPDTSCGNGMWSITFDDTRFFSQKGIWTLTLPFGPNPQTIVTILTFHFTVPQA